MEKPSEIPNINQYQDTADSKNIHENTVYVLGNMAQYLEAVIADTDGSKAVDSLLPRLLLDQVLNSRSNIGRLIIDSKRDLELEMLQKNP